MEVRLFWACNLILVSSHLDTMWQLVTNVTRSALSGNMVSVELVTVLMSLPVYKSLEGF